MSHEIGSVGRDGLKLTSFWGGKGRGRSLQLTTYSNRYVQLNRREVISLMRKLLGWLR